MANTQLRFLCFSYSPSKQSFLQNFYVSKSSVLHLYSYGIPMFFLFLCFFFPVFQRRPKRVANIARRKAYHNLPTQYSRFLIVQTNLDYTKMQ